MRCAPSSLFPNGSDGPVIGASARGLSVPAQQAPGFCWQNSSNFWASEPAGGGWVVDVLSAPVVGAAVPPFVAPPGVGVGVGVSAAVPVVPDELWLVVPGAGV